MKVFLVLITSISFSYVFADNCTYQFIKEESVIEGIGYKYTKKTGVTATFPGFELQSNKAQKSVQDLLRGNSVSVNLVTINSGNSLRDNNLRETLLTGILGDSVAKVSVKKVTEKKISTQMSLNGKEQEISFDYTIKGGLLTAKGRFDALKFALGDQIAALKKRCGSLHTGSDGKSVTWSDFAIVLKAKVKKQCE